MTDVGSGAMPDRRVSLLGGFEVAGSVPGRTALTRKGRAMFAYLALHSGHAQSREKLAALLWGGNGNSQARTNLRQTLSALRKAMAFTDGEQLSTEGDDVVLNLDHIALDVARFEELVASATPEHLEQAIALYKGDLLDGFSLREEAFEEWLRAERERLRALVIGALEKLTAHYRETGEVARCAQAAARLLWLDPLREDAHRALMRAYAAQDRLSLALKQFEVCREALQRELGLQPEPETRALYDELRARRMQPDKAASAHPVVAPVSDDTRLPRMQAAVLRQLDSAPRLDSDLPLPAKPSVAILPFEDADGGTGQAYFANGIAESIVTGLTRFHDLFVIGIKSSLALYEVTTDAQEIGRRLGVAHIVEGSVRRSGDHVRVTARLVEAATARHVWAEQYDRNLNDVFAVQDEISDLVVRTLAGRIEQATRLRTAEKPPGDMAAYDHLLQAREYSRGRTRQGELTARAHLDRALELDPNFAAAYACYAISYLHDYEGVWCRDRPSTLERAYEFARRAIALDDTDARTHHALAYAALYRDELGLAEAEIDRAIRLNRHDLPSICIRSWIVMYSGHPDEALSDVHDELRRNPMATDNILLKLGMAELTAALYREALETFSKMSSWDALRLACVAACHARLGDQERAREHAARVRELAAREFGDRAGDPLESWAAYIRAIVRFQRPDDRARFADGLDQAGLPFDSVVAGPLGLPGIQDAMHRQLQLTPPLDADPPLPAKPSVAVLAFENNSGDADQAYFANGITENIIIGLTRFHDLFVIGFKSALGVHTVSTDVREIGRRLGVAHVVQGSVRKAGDRVRVTVQLIEAATAHRLWAEQYDRCLDDMLAVEDEITDLVVTSLAGRIERASSRRAARKPPRDMAAYDHLLRAREESRHRTREGELAARGHLDRALELDSELAAAYACYAISYIHEYESAWCPDRRVALDQALRLGRKAVSLDETDAYTHQALAYAAHYSGESELARKEIDRAILLNPHDYPNLCIRAWIVMFLGRPDVALSDLNEALRLNPIATEMCLITVGIAEYMAALYRESVETFGRMSTWDSLRYACLAACHAQLGQPEQARASAEKLIKAAEAEFGGEAADSLQRWRAYAESMLRFQQPDDLARFADGLHKAGLPFMTPSAA